MRVLKAADSIQEIRHRYAENSGFGSTKTPLLFAFKRIDVMNKSVYFPPLWQLQPGVTLPVSMDCLDGVKFVKDEEQFKKWGVEQMNRDHTSAHLFVQWS